MIDSVFNGPPSSVTQPSGQAALGLDVSTGNMYYRSPQSDGWKAAGGSPSVSPNGDSLSVNVGTNLSGFIGVTVFET